MRLVDRYILRQIVLPFCIGLCTFVLIMVGDVARQLGQALLGGSVSPLLITKYLLYHTPHAISWSIPVGTIIGISWTVSVLTNQGEITAMRAAGAGFRRLCVPLAGAGLLASLGAIFCGEYLAPPASQKARELFAQIGLAQPIVQERRNVFFRDKEARRLFFVGHMNPFTNELEHITIWEQDAQGRPRKITTAQWAEVRNNIWYLREGVSLRLNEQGDQEGSVERFHEQQITLWAALQNYYATRRSAFEMSARELRDMIRTLGPAGQDTQKLAVHYHFKFSIPLAAFVFALLAAPLSFRWARHGNFVGLLIAIVIIFLYNGIRSWTLAFGLTGMLTPFWAGWIPDLVFGLAGLALLWQTP